MMDTLERLKQDIIKGLTDGTLSITTVTADNWSVNAKGDYRREITCSMIGPILVPDYVDTTAIIIEHQYMLEDIRQRRRARKLPKK